MFPDHMKSIAATTFILALITTYFFVSSASAEEGAVRLKASLGVSNYSSPYGSSTINANYQTMGVGASYIWPSRSFIDISTKISGSSATYNATEVFGALVSSDQDFKRTENSITIGKPTDNGLQLNTGIFTADTIFNLAQFGQFSQKLMGITAGAGKALAINGGSSGSFGISGSVALFKSSNTDRFGVTSNADLAYGASLGAAYNYALTQNLALLVDAKFQTYFIKYATFSGDERIFSTTASLAGQF